VREVWKSKIKKAEIDCMCMYVDVFSGTYKTYTNGMWTSVKIN
jgi:hypothetical protein